jgi:hypothetical protein
MALEGVFDRLHGDLHGVDEGDAHATELNA